METHERAANSQVCNRCNTEKPVAAFSLDNGSPKKQCKACINEYSKAWYGKNRERRLAQTAAYRAANPERYKVWLKRWEENHPNRRKQRRTKEQSRRYTAEYRLRNRDNPILLEKRRESAKRDYAKNKTRYLLNNEKRDKRQRKATPSWADFAAIRTIYREARILTQLTGIRHVVDHVIPLRGKNVSGLHVETNMQIIPASLNWHKANRLLDDIVPASGEIRSEQDKEPA